MSHEEKVQVFYDSARHCYEAIMGDYWHHADPEAVALKHTRSRSCEILHERVLSLLGLPEGGKALDFGSGIGGPTLHMAMAAGVSFVGVCNNDRLNQRARENASKRAMSDRVSFITLDDMGYKRLPFADCTFDGVTFFESVCHVPDKRALFRELARVLKPGCRLGGEDWIKRPFGSHQTDVEIMKFAGPVDEYIATRLETVEEYKRLMEDAGLVVPVARDLFPDSECWGAVQDAESAQWMGYDGPEGEMFRKGEEALAAARSAGVFSIAVWAAVKPER